MKISQNKRLFFFLEEGAGNPTGHMNPTFWVNATVTQCVGVRQAILMESRPQKIAPKKKGTVLNQNTPNCIPDSDFVGSFGRIWRWVTELFAKYIQNACKFLV